MQRDEVLRLLREHHDELEEMLGRRTDLVTCDALRPAMRAQVLTEAVYA